MDKKVDIQRTVYSREEFNKVIKRNFTTFTQPQPVVETDTVEELFRLYETLFFNIPINGARNSHEYIVKKSLELYHLEKEVENIQPLLDEVANLRTQLLESNNRILQLETEAAGGGTLDFEQATLISSLESQLQAANAKISSLESQNSANDYINNAAAQSEAEAAKAQADAEYRSKVQEVITFITVDNSAVMNDIIEVSTRAKAKKKRKRIDDSRDTNKMQTLLAQARNKFKDLDAIVDGFNESPLKKRVSTYRKGSYLGFTLIPVKE